ncbi:MAG: hypothetical protein AAF808_11130 [Cyanobacteria bacterium P01_D01_bin.2]
MGVAKPWKSQGVMWDGMETCGVWDVDVGYSAIAPRSVPQQPCNQTLTIVNFD